MGCCCSTCIPAKQQAKVVPIKSSWPDAPASSVLPRDDYSGKRTCLAGLMLTVLGGPGKIDYSDVPKARAALAGQFPYPDKKFARWQNLCDVDEITIPGGDGQDMRCYRIRPKSLAGKKNLAGFVNLHGGGAIMLTPEVDIGMWCRLCVEADVVRLLCVSLL